MVLAGGLPLAAIALVARYWPWLFGPLSRNGTVVWVCLTLQLTNLTLPSFFILLFATEGLYAEVLIAMLAALLYAIPNVLAVLVWRELLNRAHTSSFPKATRATI